jgi:tetraacyldisaccharide 4'-kinase
MKNAIPSNPKKGKGSLWILALVILSPFSFLYRLISAARTWLYQRGFCKQWKLKARVISVGNVTVGGTGKTPLVIYLAEKLKEKNRKVAILTRGYRRKKKQMVKLTKQTRERINWVDVGDEPYLLAGRLVDVPILVSKRRATSGRHAVRELGSETLILDDGFQHLKLSRDLDIVVIDSTNPFGNGRLLPAGILREPLTSLRRADLFVVTKIDQASSTDELIGILKGHNPQAPIVESIYRVRSVEDLVSGHPVEPKDIRGKSAFAFSGIGNPTSFETSLKQLGIRVLKHRKFRDHHAYGTKDIADIKRQAEESGADFIVTTEKDSVRIPLVKESEIPFYVLRIDLAVIQGEETLLNRIEGKE